MPGLRRLAAQGIRCRGCDVQWFRVLPNGFARCEDGELVGKRVGRIEGSARGSACKRVVILLIGILVLVRIVLDFFLWLVVLLVGVWRVTRLPVLSRQHRKDRPVLSGFKQFILRGNVIDLAVAVVIGAAFTAIVTSIVNNLITPLIGSFFTASDLDDALVVTLNDSHIRFGAVLGSVISFLIVAVVVYFAFVLPINTMRAHAERRRAAGESEPDAPATELDLLTEIRDLLREQQSPAPGTGRHSDAP